VSKCFNFLILLQSSSLLLIFKPQAIQRYIKQKFLNVPMGPLTYPINPTLTGVIPVTVWSFNPVIDTSLQCTQLLLELTAPTGAIVK